jgi:hydrogenase nickel incorporation protein HypA/HybF
MHEYSIVQTLIEQCEIQARQHGASRILSLEVKVGVLSGVEPQLLETAFETFRQQSPLCGEAQMTLQIQPVEVFCRACGRHSVLQQHHYVCPQCASQAIDITDGDGLFLMQLEME